jgi:hypothetical protein
MIVKRMQPLTLTLSRWERERPLAVVGWRLVVRPVQSRVFQ